MDEKARGAGIFRIRGMRKGWDGSRWVLLDLRDPAKPAVIKDEPKVLELLGLEQKPSASKLKALLAALPPAQSGHAVATSTFNGEEGLSVAATVVLEPKSGLWYGVCLDDHGQGVCSDEICTEEWPRKTAGQLAQHFADERAWDLSG